MKKLRLIITVISISLFATFSLNANEKTSPLVKKELRTQIVSMIGTKVSLGFLELKKETSANISFVINDKNELVVLSVDSINEEVSSFVKSKLNYKKIAVNGVKKGEVYSLLLKIEVKK